MQTADYTAIMTLNVSAADAFKSIQHVAGWWTADFTGQSEKRGDVFTVRFGETFITLKIVELVPDKKIGWQVIDCYKHWLKDKKEWKDTKINWEISADNNATTIHFTHLGLVPGIECYQVCEKAWNFYLKESLYKLLAMGEGGAGLR